MEKNKSINICMRCGDEINDGGANWCRECGEELRKQCEVIGNNKEIIHETKTLINNLNKTKSKIESLISSLEKSLR
jgi:ribosomal protein L40E